jgi:hypothetical protein
MTTPSVEKVLITETQRVVERTETGFVVVTGQLGPPGASSIEGLSDIDLSGKQDGAVLVYSQATGTWQATRLLEKQVMNGGFF